MLVVTALGLAVSGATAFLVQRARTIDEIDTQLARSVEDVRFVAAGRPLAGDGGPPVTYKTVRELLRTTVQQVVPRSNTGTLGLVDGVPTYAPGGTASLELSRDRVFVARVADEVAAAAAADDDGSPLRGTAATSLGNLRYIAIPLTVPGDPETGIFVIAHDVDADLAVITSAFRTYALVASVALLVVGLVGWLVAGRLLRPIRWLRETAERITVSDLSERIPVTGHDDVSELTVTANDMLDRLDKAVSSQQRLLDDVGHELRTPLTIVRGHLELMDPTDPAEVAETRALAVDELDRMTGLVSDISVLAAVQRPQALDLSPNVLTDLTEQVTRKASALSEHEWVAQTRSDAVAWLDTGRITQAWLQLAANAARYAPAGTRIVLTGDVVGERVRLSVADSGPGVLPEVRERIFERFARAEEGRGEHGSGLGLPIVAAIAHAHGGDVLLDTAVGVGAVFTIDLPWRRTGPDGRVPAGDAYGRSTGERPVPEEGEVLPWRES